MSGGKIGHKSEYTASQPAVKFEYLSSHVPGMSDSAPASASETLYSTGQNRTALFELLPQIAG